PSAGPDLSACFPPVPDDAAVPEFSGNHILSSGRTHRQALSDCGNGSRFLPWNRGRHPHALHPAQGQSKYEKALLCCPDGLHLSASFGLSGRYCLNQIHKPFHIPIICGSNIPAGVLSLGSFPVEVSKNSTSPSDSAKTPRSALHSYPYCVSPFF